VKRYCEFLKFVVVATATRLFAAPPEPFRQPIPPLDLSAAINQEFSKLTNFGITPFIEFYGVFQGNPIGGIRQRTAYSHLLLFGADFNFDKILGVPGGSLTLSGAEAAGKNLSADIGNINTVSEAFVTPLTVLFYELYWKQMLFGDRLGLRLGRMSAGDQFASIPAFGLQVSGGININPTSILFDAPFTSPPNATWAASAKIKVTKDIYAEAGIYQASDRIYKTGYHGLNFAIKGEDGELVMAEVGWEPKFFKTPETASLDKKEKKRSRRETWDCRALTFLVAIIRILNFRRLMKRGFKLMPMGFMPWHNRCSGGMLGIPTRISAFGAV
jgi:carbohydrate-selective porin OprB